MTAMNPDEPEGTFELFGIELSVCRSCEEVMVGDAELCNDCARQVPVSDLRELIDEWGVFGDVTDWNDYNKGVSDGVVECAKELEELVAEYE